MKETYSIEKLPDHMADLDRAFARCEREGIDVSYTMSPCGRPFAVLPSRAAVVRLAVRLFADGATQTPPTAVEPVAPSPGALLRAAREASGLSQTGLADVVGYSKRTIQLIEKDRQGMPAKVAAWLEWRAK